MVLAFSSIIILTIISNNKTFIPGILHISMVKGFTIKFLSWSKQCIFMANHLHCIYCAFHKLISNASLWMNIFLQFHCMIKLFTLYFHGRSNAFHKSIHLQCISLYYPSFLHGFSQVKWVNKLFSQWISLHDPFIYNVFPLTVKTVHFASRFIYNALRCMIQA